MTVLYKTQPQVLLVLSPVQDELFWVALSSAAVSAKAFFYFIHVFCKSWLCGCCCKGCGLAEDTV